MDLCTGSGAIALALASQLPAAEVVAVERSATALAWAEKNLANYRSRWGSQRAERVHVVHGDVTDMGLLQVAELAPWLGGVDVVVSNPPYVPDSPRSLLRFTRTRLKPSLAGLMGSMSFAP